jgi:hypothetical protein
MVARALHIERRIVSASSPACPTTQPRASFRYARPGIMRMHAAPARARALGLFAMMLGLMVPMFAWGEDGGRARTPARIALVVEVAIDGPDAAPLRDAINERVRAQLDALGHDVMRGGPTELRVGVGWQDEAEVAYAVTVAILQRGERVAHVTDTCLRCGTPELFGRIAATIERLTGELAAPAEDPTPPAADPAPGEAISVDRSHARPHLGVLGWFGVAAAGTGAVFGAVGAGVWARGEGIERDPSNDAVLLVTDYRPPGKALVATGGALLASGLAMLVVDVALGRRRRVRGSASVDPRGTAAVVIEGRF